MKKPESRPRRWHWLSIWVASEVLAVIGLIAWYQYPRWNRTEPAPIVAEGSAPREPAGTEADFDTLMTDIQTLDTSLRVDLRYRDRHNFTGEPLPGYEGNRAFLRREAAAALARVQQSLKPQGLGILVYDGYRPVRATEAMVAWTRRVNRVALVTDGYISDRSRHNLGVAVDCTLVDLATGTPVDMGVPFDTFSEGAHTANATGVVAANRQQFVAAMEREGFTNYAQEWWHFTYNVPPSSLRRFDVVIR